jgi:ATP-dependent protease Clp ATPase subunit
VIFPQQENVVRKLSHVMRVFAESEAAIRPHFHFTGPSGSGKTYLLGQVAKEYKLPIIEVNAAGITAEGLSGNSLSKALRKLRDHWTNPNIIFVDEFDKLFQRNGEQTEGFRSMVQDEFLTALESKYTSIFTDYGKYEPFRIDNSLFVFAGAYSNQKIDNLMGLKDAGLRTEFIGRVPLVFCTEEVPLDELQKHICNVELYQKYKALYPNTKDALAARVIVQMMQTQAEQTPIGIRLLNSVIHQYFMRDI